jgi:uncharacterized membrane protein
MRWVWIVLGVLAVLLGLVWALQGLNILGGSGMSGHIIFTVIGVIVAVVGLVLLGVGVQRGRSA